MKGTAFFVDSAVQGNFLMLQVLLTCQPGVAAPWSTCLLQNCDVYAQHRYQVLP